MLKDYLSIKTISINMHKRYSNTDFSFQTFVFKELKAILHILNVEIHIFRVLWTLVFLI